MAMAFNPQAENSVVLTPHLGASTRDNRIPMAAVAAERTREALFR